MFPSIASLASALLLPAVLAQESDETQYTVWSSVILTRTGEHTPELIGSGENPTSLTTVGANEAHAAGAFFRNRYLAAQIPANRNDSNGAGNAGAPLNGLNRDVYNYVQTSALALNQQWNVATGQAFLQGLYPPFQPGSDASNTTLSGQFDPSSQLANQTIVNGPLSGYQYPQLRTAGPGDPAFTYLSANYWCPAYLASAVAYNNTEEFQETYASSLGTYAAVGSSQLQSIPGLGPEDWGYGNAPLIYDYLRYQNVHNNASAEELADYIDMATGNPMLSELRWLADKYQYAILGNLSATNPVTQMPGLPYGLKGSISTIAGNMWASQVMQSFTLAIERRSIGANKLNLFFADYHPFMSLFALMGLPRRNRYFYGTPQHGASMAFELFSRTNASQPTFPDPDQLYVRWLFRNGSAEDDIFQSYPIFNYGPDKTDLTWREFVNEMETIALNRVTDWCTLCGAQAEDSGTAARFDAPGFCFGYEREGDGRGSSGNHSGLTPVASGVVGAVVALVVAALLFALAMFLGGIRLHKTRNQRRRDLGGFKGGQKMASDQDLTIPKGGAVVGASVEQPSTPGHERIGSWELKQNEAGKLRVPGEGNSLRPSMEEARRSPDPFADPHGIKPTMPHERV